MSLYYLKPFAGLLTPFTTQVTPLDDSATWRSTASMRLICSGGKLIEATVLNRPAMVASSPMSIPSPPPPGQDSLQLLLHGLDAAGKARHSIIQGVHFLLAQVLG